VPRIGPVLQKRLKNLGITTVGDLLYHFPQRYEDFSHFIPISQLKPKTDVAIKGKISEISSRLAWRMRMTLTEAIINDQTGSLRVVWFGKPYITDVLQPGNQVIMAGRVGQGKKGLYLNNPSYEKVEESAGVAGPPFSPSKVAGLMPIYEETKGLPSKWLRNLIRPLLAAHKTDVKELLPEKIIKENNLMPASQAIWQIHFPDSLDLAKRARERLSFEELFLIELFVLKERIKLLQTKANPIPIDVPLMQKFVKKLPFTLTDGQKKSVWQILKDMEKSHPMNRLLEGEVGSGKTVVAAMAALNTAKAATSNVAGGYQIAIMAPTEILAKQHFREVSKMLFDFKLTIALLTGKEDKIMAKKLKGEILEASRQKILKKCLNGEIDILIGTHALIQKSVRFGNLGLVIIDEQHRFGVEQRARLCQQKPVMANKQNFPVPHLLTMTATPIPRSLALTIYGDLDISILSELPKGRKKIITQVAMPKQRNGVYRFIEKQAEIGRQTFVICPRIENLRQLADKKMGQKYNPWDEVKTVTEEKKKLEKEIFPDLKVEMLHGRMKPREKEKIMRDFKNNKINILVATSVIEVGIDIPNASTMVIEGADRFGLAQLHQLRGRVGRAEHQSYCFLFTDSSSRKTKARLEAMLKAQDGFELSQMDLDIRGPGQLSGTRQWGLPDLAMASLKDLAMVEKTKNAAKEILESDITLRNYPLLRERIKRFGEKVHL
ncbi:MAG: ATP-dependent DNA helicase RecG, partial [bacterium]|nr:ATP-dependent DNA helicase RecG [bacterium]